MRIIGGYLPTSASGSRPFLPPATLIEFLSVIIGSGVCPPLILGVHADHWGIFANKCIRVKTLFESLLPQLSLLFLLKLLKFSLLAESPLFIVIFVSFQLNCDVE